LPKFVVAPEAPDLKVVGKSETKVDALKLAKGNPAFVDDFEMRGMLYAKLLTSPHAHARILDIDDSEAHAYPASCRAALQKRGLRPLRLRRPIVPPPQALRSGQL
jgi:CO/xanthine dehydrogenase Mo-binding subunit